MWFISFAPLGNIFFRPFEETSYASHSSLFRRRFRLLYPGDGKGFDLFLCFYHNVLVICSMARIFQKSVKNGSKSPLE